MAANPVSDAVADTAEKVASSLPSQARYYLAQTVVVLGFAAYALYSATDGHRTVDAIMDSMVKQEDFDTFKREVITRLDKLEKAHEHEKKTKK